MIHWLHHSDGEPYDRVIAFIGDKVFGRKAQFSPGTVMVVDDGGEVLGACLFHNYHPDEGVIEMSAASTSPRWLSRIALAEMFGYAFDQLACQAVIMRVALENTRMRRIAEAFGFKGCVVPRMRGRDKSEVFFVLGDDEWRSGKFYRKA